eukprot:Rhum_TRINITY_DN14641_c11_g1::Rhum_TRINITY_DN14641_c11_g1_i1::g.103186::m.103186
MLHMRASPDILVDFFDRDAYQRFRYALQCVHTALNSPFHTREASLAQESATPSAPSALVRYASLTRFSPTGGVGVGGSGGGGSGSGGSGSGLSGSDSSMREVRRLVAEDAAEFLKMSKARVCPSTHLPYVAAPGHVGSVAAGSRLLCARRDVDLVEGGGLGLHRHLTLLLSYDTVLLCDGNVEKHAWATASVQTLRYCGSDGGVLVLFDAGGDKDGNVCIAVRGSREADDLVHIVAKVRQAQGGVWHGAMLDTELGSMVAAQRFVDHTRTRLEAVGRRLRAEVEAKTHAADAAEEEEEAEKEGGDDADLNVDGSFGPCDTSLPCDPESQCDTCGSITRQISFSTQRSSSRHVSPVVSGLSPKSNGSSDGGGGGGCVRHPALSAMRKKVEALQEARKRQADELDDLLALCQAHLPAAAC